MNTAATEIGDEYVVPPAVPFTPGKGGWCVCIICKPDLYARHDALDKLSVTLEAWSDVLVDSENSYTTAGDDPLFDFLHAKLNSMLDGVTDEITREYEAINETRGY